MKRNITAAVLSLALAGTAAVLSGCADISAENLTEGIRANPVEYVKTDGNNNIKATDFTVELLKRTSKDGENTVISPLSAMIALSIAANGAGGTTREEFEALLTDGGTAEELNRFWYSYISDLPDEDNNKLSVADSIWIRGGEDLFTPDKDFLQVSADYYNSDVFRAPFDSTTVDDMNIWIKEKTDGEIEKMVDKLDGDVVMSIINAVTFDAKWESKYEHNDVTADIFTNYDGTESDVQMMRSNEMYIESDEAAGFIKRYENGFSFAAVMPNENIKLGDYIKNLDSSKIDMLINKGGEYDYAETYLPKFKAEASTDMNDALKDMGIATAFDSEKADFSGLGNSKSGTIYISSVLQNTTITVDELGTKAAAVTKIEVLCGSAMPPEITVILNRPFMYLIIDNATQIPVFAGTVSTFNA